jgi:hypothetical protein
MPTCPECGAEGVPIIYGLVTPDWVESEEAARGAVLGGCVIEPESPNWACKGPVEHRWFAEETVEDHS